MVSPFIANLLFPMVQRYKFESKSQLGGIGSIFQSRCFQWFKDTNLKVNHNLAVLALSFNLVVSNGSKIQI